MRGGRGTSGSVAVALLRWILRVYPPAVRALFAEDIERTFREETRRLALLARGNGGLRGPLAGVAVGAHTLLTLASLAGDAPDPLKSLSSSTRGAYRGYGRDVTGPMYWSSQSTVSRITSFIGSGQWPASS